MKVQIAKLEVADAAAIVYGLKSGQSDLVAVAMPARCVSKFRVVIQSRSGHGSLTVERYPGSLHSDLDAGKNRDWQRPVPNRAAPEDPPE